ncbi:MAG: hypothetical protein Q3X95_00650 [Duodenibacillus sp.]|nr:hypothetical protein [Duodenibacillus sp.]
MSAETAVRIKLPRGEASYKDLSNVRDLYNCLSYSLLHRQKAIDQQEAEASGAVLYQAAEDLSTVIKRGTATDHYVCRASEMKSILSALQTASDFITDSLETCPLTLLAEFNAALLIKESLPEHGEIVVLKKTSELAYRLALQLQDIRKCDFPAWHRQATAAIRNHMEAISKGERQ